MSDSSHATLGYAAATLSHESGRRAWRRHFATRVRASALFAAVMLRPWGAEACARVLGQAPRLLTWGAWWSGKSQVLPLAADPA